MGLMLKERDENHIIFENTSQKEERYDILANFPFSSETKRMGIIVRKTSTNEQGQEFSKIIFYLKGADVAIIEKVRPYHKSDLQEACEKLGDDGLRTLVIT